MPASQTKRSPVATIRAWSIAHGFFRFLSNQISFQSLAILVNSDAVPKRARRFTRPANNRLQKYPVTRASHSDSDAEIELELRQEIKIQRRHNEMLLFLHLCQRLYRSHVAVVLDRRRKPVFELVDQHPRRIELKTVMRARAP